MAGANRRMQPYVQPNFVAFPARVCARALILSPHPRDNPLTTHHVCLEKQPTNHQFPERSPQSNSVDDTNPPPAKRSRLGDPTVTLTAAELRAASKDELVAHIIVLQKEIKKPAEQAPAPKSMTPEQITAKVDNEMMISGIKSQMKWKPSCKKGGAKFTYSAFVPDAAVFFHLFEIPQDFKKKQLVMTPREFQDKVAKCSIVVSIWYNSLELTGDKVKIGWNKEENPFSVGGSYGL